jgi:glycosyltransferase involved in cell wall biosynthesis
VRVVFILGTTSGGTGTHVRMLAAALAGRGIPVSVFGPSRTGGDLGFAAVGGVEFAPVEFGDRPRAGDAVAVLRLRRLLGAGRADVAHAHGLRAGALAVLALAGVRGTGRRPALVVTAHNAPPAGAVVPALIYRALELVVARGADIVLCVSGDLERRMRAAGARCVARAVVPAAVVPAAVVPGAGPAADALPPAAAGRPIVLAAGRLAAQKGFGTLLEAAVSWQDMGPRPLVMIAGEGPLDAGLRRRARALGVDAEFAGRRDDVPALLAAASVFVLPSLWEGQPLILQEALRAGAAIVASRAGGIGDLTGNDAAVLIPPGDANRLGAAIRSVLEDRDLAGRLRAAAVKRAAGLPSADDAAAAVLAAYAEALAARNSRFPS